MAYYNVERVQPLVDLFDTYTNVALDHHSGLIDPPRTPWFQKMLYLADLNRHLMRADFDSFDNCDYEIQGMFRQIATEARAADWQNKASLDRLVDKVHSNIVPSIIEVMQKSEARLPF